MSICNNLTIVQHTASVPALEVEVRWMYDYYTGLLRTEVDCPGAGLDRVLVSPRSLFSQYSRCKGRFRSSIRLIQVKK